MFYLKKDLQLLDQGLHKNLTWEIFKTLKRLYCFLSEVWNTSHGRISPPPLVLYYQQPYFPPLPQLQTFFMVHCKHPGVYTLPRRLILIKFLGNQECLNPNPSDGSLTRLTSLPRHLQLCIRLFTVSQPHGKLKIFKQLRASQRVRNCQNKTSKRFH